MPHNVFRGASEQNAFQPGPAVRRSHDQVRTQVPCATANLLSRVSALQRVLHLQILPVDAADQLEHLFARRFFGRLEQRWKIVKNVFGIGAVIGKVNRMEQDEPGPELRRERFGIGQALCGTR